MVEVSPWDYFFGTGIGKLKIASAVMAFVIIVLASVGHHAYKGLIDICDKTGVGGVLASPVILIATLIPMGSFVLFTILAPLFPQLRSEAVFPKMDAFGHLACAIVQLFGGIVAFAYVSSIFLTVCEKDFSDYGDTAASLFVISGVLSFAQMVLCFLIYVKVKAAIPVLIEPQGEDAAGKGTSTAAGGATPHRPKD